MIQEIYQRAMKYAGEQHKDQKVPGLESNYLLHLSNVAMEVIMAYNSSPSFDLRYAIQLAILHDTIEDTNSTYNEISELFGEEVAEGVQALTKNESLQTKEDQMLDSLNRIKKKKDEVGLVKLADRITNLQKPPKHWPNEKVIEYAIEAKLISERLAKKNKYLNERIELKIQEYERYAKEEEYPGNDD